MFFSPTFKLHLQHFILIVNDVAIWVDGVAGTVYADFQTQVTSCMQTIMKDYQCILAFFFKAVNSLMFWNSYLFRGEMHHYDFRSINRIISDTTNRDQSLTSVHEPFSHGFCHVEGDPFRRPFG